jgi:hypothetical protein
MLNLDGFALERIQWIQAFDAFARSEFKTEIIDFNLLHGLVVTFEPETSSSPQFLLETGRRIVSESIDHPSIANKLSGHLAVLEAMLGQVSALGEFVGQTQRIAVQKISTSDIDALRQRAETAANACNSNLRDMVFEPSPFGEEIVTDRESVKALFDERFEIYRTQIEARIDLKLAFEVEVSFVEIDQYWRFWVDGVGDRFRLRFNRFRDGFTASQIDQFVLHELIAHCGQATGWRNEIIAGNLDPVHGLTAIHTWEQAHLEGLAQTIPLFLESDIGDALRARVLKDALRQALLNNAYIDTENGMPVDQALAACDAVLPVNKPLRFFKSLADQKRHPQLRSYMFAYPAGLLALLSALDRNDFDQTAFLRASYRQPLELKDLI